MEATYAANFLLQQMLKGLKKLYGKIVKTYQIEETNFYTVRTYKFAYFLSSKMNISPTADNQKVSITKEQTNEILDTYDGDIDKNALKKDLPTVLYFDNESIEQSKNNIIAVLNGNNDIVVNKFKDGELFGLTKVQSCNGTIAIIDTNKELESSEILRALAKSNS